MTKLSCPPNPVERIAAALEALGYESGSPPWLKLANAVLDAKVAASSACESCGHDGLEYRPFYRGRSYRALAVCPACRHCVEF